MPYTREEVLSGIVDAGLALIDEVQGDAEGNLTPQEHARFEALADLASEAELDALVEDLNAEEEGPSDDPEGDARARAFVDSILDRWLKEGRKPGGALQQQPTS